MMDKTSPQIELSDTSDLREDLSESERRDLLALATEVADCASGRIREVLTHGLDSSIKADGTIVTKADTEAEQAVRRFLDVRFPEAGVLGEEYGHTKPNAEYQVILDPVDGTLDLAYGIPTWGSVSAIYYKGHPVAGTIDHVDPKFSLRLQAAHGLGTFEDGKRLPTLKNADKKSLLLAVSSPFGFHKLRSVGIDEYPYYIELGRTFPNKREFFSCFSQVCCATGRVDAAVEWNLRIWDLAVERLAVEEAGGRFEIFRKTPVPGNEAYHYYCVVAGRSDAVQRVLEVLRSVAS